MNRAFVSLLSLAFILFSCDGNRVYEKFEEVPNQLWGATDTLSFELENLDSAKKFLISVRFNDEYPHSNIYMTLLASDTLGNPLQEELVNVVLFDQTGKPKGKGFGGSRTLYDTLNFRIHPNAQILDILQYMRVNQLKGVEAVGFKAIK